MKPLRNTDSIPGQWYIDTACINCGASRHVAPGLIAERNDKSVFIRQPVTPEEQLAAWRAVLICPTASVRSETKQPRPSAAIFPQQITADVWRCGFNARSFRWVPPQSITSSARASNAGGIVIRAFLRS